MSRPLHHQARPGYRATGAANITGAATGTARATWNIGRAAAAAAAALASAGPKTESGLHWRRLQKMILGATYVRAMAQLSPLPLASPDSYDVVPAAP